MDKKAGLVYTIHNVDYADCDLGCGLVGDVQDSVLSTFLRGEVSSSAQIAVSSRPAVP